MQEADRLALAADLARALRGEVRFDGATRGIYATDSSNYRHVPLGVVYPADREDLAAALSCCRQAGAAVLARGAGTSLAGQACNEAVVIDTSRHLNAIRELDPQARLARVEPGVVLDDLRRAAERHGLTFGPDPATHAWCTLGGMIGNNSCGTHGVYAGKTVDNVEELALLSYRGDEFVAAAGGLRPLGAASGTAAAIEDALHSLIGAQAERVRQGFPKLARRVSGFNLDELLPERGFHVARALVGTESTCAVVTEATLRLVTSPPVRRLIVLAFPDVFAAADAVPDVLDGTVIALEGIDAELVAQMRAGGLHLENLSLLPPGGGWLLAEVGAEDDAEADALAAAVAARHHAGEAATYSRRADQAAVWQIRESGLGATARPPGRPPNFEGVEDAAVPPERLGEYLRGLSGLWRHYGYSGALYGHFGQGCVHTRNDFDFSSVSGLRRYREFVEAAADLCISLGGSLSGEHGDGQARGELLAKMFGPELVAAFGQMKTIFDPDHKLNPGCVVDARRLDDDIRFGPDYRRVELGRTRFAFAADGGSLRQSAERCVGVGRCRQAVGGMMCPSFRATGDERHSTRGRAKLLVELFQGETTPATWRNEEVFEALELCLSCKACATECPTRVDMATYKAEFLSHYYARRLRPASAYLLALLPFALRTGRLARLVQPIVAGEHRLGRALRRAVGITVERPVPALAPERFSNGDGARARRRRDGSVVLFADTFTDNYLPQRAAAAVRVLEAVGEVVTMPRRSACCGRPLFDTGMLALARRTLSDVLDVLAPSIDAGVPIIVLEPSCLATFRDELPALLPNDPRAARLCKLSRSLAEHLIAIGRPLPVAGTGEVAIHAHCHQRATVGTGADRELLSSVGFDVEVLDTGCCGLAGSFGFRADHAEVSRRVAETSFLPTIARLGADTTLVTDGFSCATQAAQLARRPTTSLAELLAANLTAAS